MTDQREDDRAAAAFREALRREADAFEPVGPLTIAEPKPVRRALWVLAAAACIALIAGGLVWADGARSGPKSTPGPAGTEQSAQTEQSADPNGPQPVSELPEPQAGWRWETYLNVAIQVPEDWGDQVPYDSSWCSRSSELRPRSPYVALPRGIVASVGCTYTGPANPLNPGVPRQLNQTFVSFDASGPPKTAPVSRRDDGDWHLLSKQMTAWVKVSVLTDDAHLDVAQQIVESATVTTVDGRGCSTGGSAVAVPEKTPAPPAGTPLETMMDVDQVRICQYYRNLEFGYLDSGENPFGGRPALAGSRIVTGDEARALVSALQAAPEGGGPDFPKICAKGSNGDDALTMDFFSGGQQVGTAFVYYSGCRGNGIYDGTTVREITGACRTWFGGRVTLTQTSGNLGDRCFGG